MATSSRKIIIVILGCIVLGLCGFIFIFGNPLNIGVQASDKFTVAKFLAISEGENIEQVVESLGAPIRIVPADPQSPDCKNCTYYYFEGNPADWLVAYREAWVIVGPDGIVYQRILHTEP